jgi:hypothetical protein
MDKDWKEFGAKAFTFEVVDTLEKKKVQSHEQFTDDLKLLMEFWAEKGDKTTRY